MGSIIRSSGRLLPETQFPFTTITKIATTKLQQYSCGSREEESYYELTTYSRQRKQLNQIHERIRSIYDYATISVANRQVNGIWWDGWSISELETGLFCGKIRYKILAEKLLVSDYNLSSVIGQNFLECIYNRYLAEQIKFNALGVTGLFTSNYAKDIDYPFITCSSFDAIEAWRDTQNQAEEVNFSFQVWANTAQKVEEIKELLMLQYDFIQMNMTDRVWASMLYQGDTLMETDSGLWSGEVDYQLIQEKALT